MWAQDEDIKLISEGTSFTTIESEIEEESLNLSLISLVEAADRFLKAGSYKKFNDCERKAKLVALQIALLPYEIVIVNLKQSQLADVIIGFDSFADAYIVADFYEYHLAWRRALFKNVILEGKLIYLEDFCQKCDLSSSLVEELVLLYKQHIKKQEGKQPTNSNESAKSARAMRALLSKLANVELKCKIFTQLNFKDSKEELLQDAATRAHLQDIKLA